MRLFRSNLPTVTMARFQTVIKCARFVYSPYTATEMQGFAQVLADSIRARIQSGQNILRPSGCAAETGAAGPAGYPDYKAARGLQPIRDWTWSALRCLKVVTANENRAIGFLDEARFGLANVGPNRRRAAHVWFHNVAADGPSAVAEKNVAELTDSSLLWPEVDVKRSDEKTIASAYLPRLQVTGSPK